jgi:hypothetical protein
MRPIHGLLLASLSVIVFACAGGTTGSAGTGSVEPAASTSTDPGPASSEAPPASGPAASVGVALPAECVEAIRAFLVAVEPIVSGVDWRTAIDVPGQIAGQLEDASTNFDVDSCPDVSEADAHEAWIAIGIESAPGTLDYIDFIYQR